MLTGIAFYGLVAIVGALITVCVVKIKSEISDRKLLRQIEKSMIETDKIMEDAYRAAWQDQCEAMKNGCQPCEYLKEVDRYGRKLLFCREDCDPIFYEDGKPLTCLHGIAQRSEECLAKHPAESDSKPPESDEPEVKKDEPAE